jgi:hypothetical protein
MRSSWKLVAAGALAVAAGVVQANDPSAVQDPPGEVDVRQPAGVSLTERNTERDTTDTLGEGGRTEVIGGERAQATEGRADMQPGAEARTGFGEGSGAAAAAEPSFADEDQPTETAEATSLGADTGHGTGTELEAPAPARR